MREFLEPEILRKIFNLVSGHPGIDLVRMAELLNMKMLTVESYLIFMEDKGVITSVREDGYRRYYILKSGLKPRYDRRTQETRTKIFDLITNNPGIHLSKIAEMLDMSPPLTEYHLLQLEKNDLIMSVKEERGYYKRFYVKDSDVGVKDKKILALLRQEPLLKIVLLLIRHVNLRHKELLENLDIGPSTLSYHLNKLVENGIIEVFSYGKEKGYALKNASEIVWVVRKYKLDRMIEGFKDIWKDLNLL